MFVIDHALSCTASFQACHGNAIGFSAANNKERQLLFSARGFGLETRNLKLGLPCWKRDSYLWPPGLESSALTTWPCFLFNEVLILCDVTLGSSTNQELHILATGKNYQIKTEQWARHLPPLNDQYHHMESHIWPTQEWTNDNRSGLVGNYWQNTNHKPELSWPSILAKSIWDTLAEFDASASICL